MGELEKAIKGLEICTSGGVDSGLKCTDCPYYEDCKFNPMKQMLKDAFSLLEAQRPRVMTLDELSALSIDTPVFIEESNGECGWNIFYGIDEEEKEICFCGFKATADYYRLEEYGESWRCWTSQPTDEQREATK